MTWHLDQPTADAYVRRSTDAVTTTSVEAHLVACDACQARVAGTTDPGLDDLLTGVWARVDEVLDRPRIGLAERTLRAVGCGEATARILTASARARWSYLVAVAISVVMAIRAAWTHDDAAFGVFLLLAPVGPLVATAGAFGRWSDPLHALLRSLPTSPWRIALVRTIASVVPAIVLTLLTVPILDERGWLAAAWLLPSLALSVAALALSTWIRIESATLAVGAVWLAVPLVVRPGPSQLIDAIAGRAQVVALIVVVVATVVVVVRRDTFEYQVVA